MMREVLANAAWLVIATLAHNLLRWTAAIGLGIGGQVVAKRFSALRPPQAALNRQRSSCGDTPHPRQPRNSSSPTSTNAARWIQAQSSSSLHQGFGSPGWSSQRWMLAVSGTWSGASAVRASFQ